MQTPDKVDASRAFIKKAYNFIKYYPLRRKDPAVMLLNTIKELRNLVDSCQNISELDPISEIVKTNGNYQNTEGLFQIEIEEEEKRVIVYRPSKLLGSTEDGGEIVYLYDIVVIE